MLGGYQILDLRSIDLSRSTSEASISDVYVLRQLLYIRDHIQKTYDFSKPLHNQLKPLLIRYRDKKVGEKHEVACYGNIEVINTYYKFRIIANNEGEQLTINVEFEEKTDEYDNKYWDIKTAKILLTSEVAIFENITDKDGHKRFIEGDIDLVGDIPEGITKIFGKWSLSGSHLMIVLCLKGLDTTVLSNGTPVAICKNLPSWVINKIVPIWATALENTTFDWYSDAWNQQSQKFYLYKYDNSIRIASGGNITLTSDKQVRIHYDLLIDNE